MLVADVQRRGPTSATLRRPRKFFVEGQIGSRSLTESIDTWYRAVDLERELLDMSHKSKGPWRSRTLRLQTLSRCY